MKQSGTPKLSIIVPVYNVEKYLDECIDSIICQTFTDYEILLVNDGSIDDSGHICEEWARKDERIKVFHKANGGQSTARNLALRYTQGKYIMFIDSDDVLGASDTVSRLIREMDDYMDIDFIQFITKTSTEDRDIFKVNLSNGTALLEGIESIMGAYAIGEISRIVCDKIFRRSFIDRVLFPEGVYYEDECFVLSLLPQMQKVVLSDIGSYIYRIRDDSTTHQTFSVRHASDLFKKDFYGVQIIKNMAGAYDLYLRYYTSAIREYLNVKLLTDKDGLRVYKRPLRKLAPNWKNLFHSNITLNEKLLIVLIKLTGFRVLNSMIKLKRGLRANL